MADIYHHKGPWGLITRDPDHGNWKIIVNSEVIFEIHDKKVTEKKLCSSEKLEIFGIFEIWRHKISYDLKLPDILISNSLSSLNFSNCIWVGSAQVGTYILKLVLAALGRISAGLGFETSPLGVADRLAEIAIFTLAPPRGAFKK